MADEIAELDPGILAKLPPGIEIESIVQHGKTNWSTGLRVDVVEDGEDKEYFIKIIEQKQAAAMAEGEYEGQKALAALAPDNTVHPMAWGTFQDDPSKAFFITTFRNLRAESPTNAHMLAILKQIHSRSKSPNGKFGFPVTTFLGSQPMITSWTDSWEEYFTREFKANFEFAMRERGNDEELHQVYAEFVAKVIPRLLRPLQTGGRSIRPTLCHGDLWDGNIQYDIDTRQTVLFDSCCFYGHNEMDFQCMREPRYAIGPEFVNMYKLEIGPSEPVEDFDDRNALYSMRNDITTAGMWRQWASLLVRVKDEMNRLLAKYPDGYEGFEKSEQAAATTDKLSNLAS